MCFTCAYVRSIHFILLFLIAMGVRDELDVWTRTKRKTASRLLALTVERRKKPPLSLMTKST